MRNHAPTRRLRPEPAQVSTRPPFCCLPVLMAALLLASGGAASQVFSAEALPAGDGPRDVIVEDLNLDGWLDLAVANQGSHDVSVIQGLWDGIFAPAFPVPVAQGPVALASLDADDDGWPDLAVACTGTGRVCLARGKGDLSFYPAAAFDAGGIPADVLAADLDGDGLDDVLVAADNGVWWLRSTGDGSLEPPVSVAAGLDASSLGWGDLDGRAGLDLAVAEGSTSSVRILLNQDSGAFAESGSLAVLAQPRGLSLTDLDGDGHVDVLVANAGAAQVSIFMGLGAGAFEAGRHVDAGPAPDAAAAVDLDGDLHQDLVVVSSGTGQLLALMAAGQADSTGFLPPAALPMTRFASAVAVTDLDGDFQADLAYAGSTSDQVVLLHNRAGPFVDLGGGADDAGAGLELHGAGLPAATQPVVLELAGAPADAVSAFLFASTELGSDAWKGGLLTLVPQVVLPMPADAPLALHWPAAPAPGSSVFLQAWIPAGSGGATHSNALRVIVQSP